MNTLFEQNKNALPKGLQEGYKLLSEGIEPTYSTGICDCVTVGYGTLDEYGYWEFPLSLNEDTERYLTLEEYLGEEFVSVQCDTV